MNYIDVVGNDYIFKALIKWYYETSRGKELDDNSIDNFIKELYEKVESGKIMGLISMDDNIPVGFILFLIDGQEFSLPGLEGCGSIIEVGIIRPYRNKGFGTELVLHAESVLAQKGVKKVYVCTTGPNDGFWRKSGYTFNGRLTKSGQSVFEKCINDD